MIDDAILLAGGLATRLGPITRVTNKHLLPVYDKPMIFYGLETLRDVGVKNITIILGGNSVGDIVNLVRDGDEFGLNITYKYQHTAGGISQAIALAKNEILGDYFLVLLGDNIFADRGALLEFVDGWTLDSDEALIVTTSVKNPSEYGQPIFNRYGSITGFIEKSTFPKHDLIVTGFYGLPKKAFDAIQVQVPSIRGELEIVDTLSMLLPNIIHEEYKGFWTDCGTPEGLVSAGEYFSRAG